LLERNINVSALEKYEKTFVLYKVEIPVHTGPTIPKDNPANLERISAG
jgi:hypothetical protein